VLRARLWYMWINFSRSSALQKSFIFTWIIICKFNNVPQRYLSNCHSSRIVGNKVLKQHRMFHNAKSFYKCSVMKNGQSDFCFYFRPTFIYSIPASSFILFLLSFGTLFKGLIPIFNEFFNIWKHYLMYNGWNVRLMEVEAV
jgi:hypothetical protein